MTISWHHDDQWIGAKKQRDELILAGGSWKWLCKRRVLSMTQVFNKSCEKDGI